ncbi:unnamed protein product, partial [Ectocarpus fasciculatus]
LHQPDPLREPRHALDPASRTCLSNNLPALSRHRRRDNLLLHESLEAGRGPRSREDGDAPIPVQVAPVGRGDHRRLGLPEVHRGHHYGILQRRRRQRLPATAASANRGG